MNDNRDVIKEIEIQIKLHINERLFQEELITEEMYEKAKIILLSS